MLNNYDYLFKIIFLGEPGVGKTSIIYRYLYDSIQSYYFAVGYSFKNKLIDFNNKLIKMRLWDSAFSEHRIKDAYYKKANGAIIVYDKNYKDSFIEVKNWLKEIKENAPDDISLILVGNKCDLSERKVTEEEGKKIAEEFNTLFIEISAKTGHNIYQVFDMLIKDIFDNINKSSIKIKNDGIIDKVSKCFK